MAQESTGSTVVLRLQSIREIREIRGQNHFRKQHCNRTRPSRNSVGGGLVVAVKIYARCDHFEGWHCKGEDSERRLRSCSAPLLWRFPRGRRRRLVGRICYTSIAVHQQKRIDPPSRQHSTFAPFRKRRSSAALQERKRGSESPLRVSASLRLNPISVLKVYLPSAFSTNRTDSL